MDLIFDRTLGDVSRWKELRAKSWGDMKPEEQREWLSNMKGCYGYTDMNRVENAVATVSRLLKELGYEHETPVVKTNWSRSDLPNTEDMSRYYRNIGILRGAIHTYPDTPMAPREGERMTHVIANNIERILFDINDICEKIPQGVYHLGEIFSGEV